MSGPDGEITVGGPRLRALLALLLVRTGRTVTGDQLAEAIWDAEVSPRSRAALPSYVMRLRRALGPEAGARLVTRSGGYAVELGEDELDLLAFRDLCARAQTLVDGGDLDAAEPVLAEALGLWRGESLVDVPESAVLRAELDLLDSARVRARHQHIEVRLGLGRHAGLLGELAALTGAHPFDERLRAHLMLALHRSGRRAEALEVFQGGRRALVEQLGIEPGAQLRELHRAVLADDPALLLVPGAAPAAAIVRPGAPARSPEEGRAEPPTIRSTAPTAPAEPTSPTEPPAPPARRRSRRPVRSSAWIGGVVAVLLATTAVSDGIPPVERTPVADRAETAPPVSRDGYVTRIASEGTPVELTHAKGEELEVGAPVREGDTLVVSVLLGGVGPGPVSVSDTVDNRYRLVGDPIDVDGSRLAVFVSVRARAMDQLDMIRILWPDAAQGFVTVDEFRGVGAAGPWAQSVSAEGPDADGTDLVLGGMVPCETGDVLFGAIASNGGAAPDLPAGWHRLPTVDRLGARRAPGPAELRLTTAYRTWSAPPDSSAERAGTASKGWRAVLFRLR
ncbi:BTAD domain-containing putative transcriptional regulator [Kitasatospora misakiensis]|uniref:BTAD domain-containing putative transcriptional regulator n=1 Tax=Kitasatospora misakiensis TaxID=67330 RepID=A0ABW0X572_9ACTN